MVVSDNLLSVSQDFFSPSIVQKISDIIGQSAEKTRTGLKSVIPTLMTGIVDKGSTPEGAASLVDLVNTHHFESAEKADESQIAEGNAAVTSIFGNKLESVVARLQDSTGLSSFSINKILGLVTPTLMGVIGSKIKNEQMSSTGLMNFLSQQKSWLTGFSAGFSNVSNISHETSESFHKVSQDIPWRAIALVALVLLGLWFWWLGAHQQTTPPIVTTATQAERAVSPNVTLPASEVAAFLAAGTIVDLPKRFRFEKLVFQTGSSILQKGSEVELDRIATAMKEHPASMATIEGYTDNVGLDTSNRMLSADRAFSVKNQLVLRGVAATRLTTVGMGSDKPIADNATAEGRAINRRIEFVVTKLK
jgi:outer membrane protein OmpA-like peptidoglycan-associated protein